MTQTGAALSGLVPGSLYFIYSCGSLCFLPPTLLLLFFITITPNMGSCSVCKKTVAKSAKALRCSYCTSWYHMPCISFGSAEYEFMAQGRQGFRWFCVDCEDTVTGLLRGSSSSTDLEKKIMDNVSAGMSNILDKLKDEISNKIEALEYKIDTSLQQHQDPTSQPETFASILKTALEESKNDQGNVCESGTKVNDFGKSRTVRNQQVLVVKPKESGPMDAAKVATVTGNIEEALKSVPVDSLRKTKTGSLVMKFPSEKAKVEAVNLMGSCLDGTSEFSVSEPRKMLPKMTLTGISTSYPDAKIIESIIMKNKEIELLVAIGSTLTLVFTKVKGDYKFAVLKMSPEIRAAIERTGGYVYVGLDRCRAYDRFWVTQCYHCQKFGHIASKCPKKDNEPVCAFCASNHMSQSCTSKSSPLCSNCSSHDGPADSHRHFASSSDCPAMVFQRQKLIENTNFVSSKNL